MFWLGATEASSLSHWLLEAVVIEILGGIALGAGAGWLTAKALTWAKRQPEAERASLVSAGLALALTLLGAGRLLDSDGILAAFVAGLVVNQSLTGDLEAQKNRFHDTLRRFFELPIFWLLGLVLPWGRWVDELGWAAIGLVVLVLLLRRLPFVWLLSRFIPPVRRRDDAWFVGWFGPIGVAALYYAAVAVDRTGDDRIW